MHGSIEVDGFISKNPKLNSIEPPVKDACHLFLNATYAISPNPRAIRCPYTRTHFVNISHYFQCSCVVLSSAKYASVQKIELWRYLENTACNGVRAKRLRPYITEILCTSRVAGSETTNGDATCTNVEPQNEQAHKTL
ncbi:Uncharacterized protein Rs2_08296 [Raphanus sativus]|nr:Uncharacterized protein Rs2_08296 [Raphanus sativus]